MRLPLRTWVFSGIISLGSTGAWAAETKTSYPSCTTAPTEADRKAAQGAFAAGQGSFNEADYATAVLYWKDAYRRDCTAHALLLNLGRAFELKGDRPEAVNALETFLQRKPDAADADQIRRRIENLKAQIAATAPAPVVAPVAAPPPVAPAAPKTVQFDSSKEGSRSALPLVVAGAGGALAVFGVVGIALGNGKISDAEKTCPSRGNMPGGYCSQDDADKGNAGRHWLTGGVVALSIGGGAIGGGLLWYFLSSPSSDGHAQRDPAGKFTALTPAVAPGYTGLSWSGAF